MKFVLTYTNRDGGSEVELHEAGKRALALLSKWQPSASTTVREWLTRCDGNGGFSVFESDNPTDMLKDIATWSTFSEFTLYPVVDVADGQQAEEEAIALRDAIS